MTSTTDLADRTIAALRATHDELVVVAQTVADEQLSAPSGATEWSIADVLSHLGSGAEIALATLNSATSDADRPGDEFNHRVWDRWNALSPREQADEFVTSDEAVVAAYEALTPEQRATVTVDMGYMPAPLSIAANAGLRLSEAAMHGWDVRVGLDADARVADETAAILADQYLGEIGVLLGFAGKADQLDEPATVAVGGTGYGIVVADRASFVSPVRDATATLAAPLESAMRLLVGRLGPRYTPSGVDVSGNVTLDDLRRVFPGY